MYDPAFEKYSLGKVCDSVALASRSNFAADKHIEGDFLGEGNS